MQWPEGTNPELEIETNTHNLEEDSVARFITWIPWDSGFRGTGLRVGDLVIGHDDIRYTAETAQKNLRIGDGGFSRWLDDKNFKPNDIFKLLIQRKDGEIVVEGKLGGYRSYKNKDEKRILGEGGPITYEKDGFDYAWDAWYRQFVDLAKVILAGWDYYASTISQNLAERMLPFAQRVIYLQQHYPCAFTQTVVEDYEAMKIMVAGEKRELTEADIVYRTLGSIRATRVTAVADQAFADFLAQFEQKILVGPPSSPNSFSEDTSSLLGQLICLPEVGKQQLLFETRGNWYWSGRGSGGYLIDKKSPSLQPLYAATDEYIEKVDPYFRDPRITFIGVVQEEPVLVCDAHRNITVSGLKVEPIAALVANAADKEKRFFVDMQTEKSAEAFAGEAALEAGIKRPVLMDDASPEQVFMTAIAALKMGDMETWLSCYANWTLHSYYERDRSFIYVDQAWEIISRISCASIWDKARQRLMDDVYGVEVASASPAKVIFNAQDQAIDHKYLTGSPSKVEQVRLLVNHIGKIGEEYRTFAGFMLHRRWELQRLDGGPWRITSPHAI